MTCANCPNEAAYQVNDPGANPVAYCTVCLPAHLQGRAAAGQLALPKAKKT